jgi:HlyD family secretion protein
MIKNASSSDEQKTSGEKPAQVQLKLHERVVYQIRQVLSRVWEYILIVKPALKKFIVKAKGFVLQTVKKTLEALNKSSSATKEAFKRVAHRSVQENYKIAKAVALRIVEETPDFLQRVRSGVEENILRITQSRVLQPTVDVRGTHSLRHELHGTCLFGGAVVGIFLLIAFAWSSAAPLSGAVIASGMVGVEGSRKTVQHLEGGIIGKILITEGDHVAEGDTLIEFDDIRIRARVEELRNRVRTLVAQEARLRAERASFGTILFDHELLQDQDDPEVQAIISQQISQFETRGDNLITRESILFSRKAQLKQQANGVERQLEGVREQLRLIQEEAATVKELLEQGYDRKPRLLALLRDEAGLVAQEGELIALMARNKEAVGETELRVLSLKTDQLEEVDATLSNTQSERISIEKIYWESVDQLARTSVTSPVKGIVINLAFKTVGGVVRPGEVLMEVVPEEEGLIVNVRLRPQDIDEVRQGMEAYVVFPSYAQRYLHRISGDLIHVSADVIRDDKTGEFYFLAKIRVNTEDLERQAKDIKLTPGMPAEVFIATADRTFFEYLMQPLSRTFERAMRES